MIAVVVVAGKEGMDASERLGLDTKRFQAFRIIGGQSRDLAHAVVHDAHIHTLCRLVGQYLKDAAPHEAFRSDEIFKEDEFLSILQFFQHCFKLSLSRREESSRCMFVDREAATSV